MTDDTALAASWLEGLASRGLSASIRNGRLWLHPARAYKELTDAEIITLRHHRAAIKALIKAGAAPLARDTEPLVKALPTAESVPAPPTRPAVCPFCMVPCVGREHPVFATLHSLDPAEIARRSQEAAANELDAREYLATGRITEHMRERAEARRPKLTPEEVEQAETRRRLGWDAGVLNEVSGYRRHE